MLDMLEKSARKTIAKSGITTEIATYTPETAKAALERNTQNRKVRENIVRRYMRDMKDGAWQITGDAIRFDTAGNLLDGQHRLLACVRSGATFTTFVMYGLPPVAQDVMDIGNSRKADDVLAMRGHANSSIIASVLRHLLGERDGIANIYSNTYSTAQVLAAYERHPNIARYCIAPGRLQKGLMVTDISFLTYIGAEILGHPKLAARFADVLLTGVPAYQGDPVHYYRERCLRDMGDHVKLTRIVRSRTLRRAFNMHLKSKPGPLKFSDAPSDIDGLDIKKL